MLRIAALTIVLFFYTWTVTDGTYNFYRENKHAPLYSYLADGFLHGQLHFVQKPPLELLNLENPYDTYQNKDFRTNGWHDVSLYRGKYYLYFGPVPAIVLFMPFKLLTKKEMSDRLAILIFSFGTLIWATFIIGYLKKKYFPTVPEYMVATAILLVGFANVCPYLLRRALMYSIAIASAIFFTTAAIYFLSRAIEKHKLNIVWLSLGSLFVGLAGGCRPHFILSGIVLIIYLYFLIQKNYFPQAKHALKALVIPFIICLITLFAYNYLRFEDITDFGFKYQLARNKLTITDTMGVIYCASNINWYFFTTPHLFSDFPYVLLRLWKAPYFSQPYERILGLFPGIPFVLLIFEMLIVKWLLKSNKLKSVQNSANFPKREFIIIIIPGIVTLSVLLTLCYVTMRYLADYMTFFILAGIIAWFYLYIKLIQGSLFSRVTNLFAYSSAIYSILIGIAASIIGPDLGLVETNNPEFRKLQLLFFPVSVFFHYFDKNI